MLRHDIEELPPLQTFVADRIALLGDAAHAMTPTLGQGACQAIEDAVVLARVAEAGRDLAEYDRVRRPRTRMITNRSARLGTVLQFRARPLAAARDALLRSSPSSVQLKSLATVLDWAP